MSRIRQGRVPDIIRTELGMEAYEFFDDWFRETFGADIGERGKLDRSNIVNVENLQTGETTANKVLRSVGNDNVAFEVSPGLDAEYLTLSPDPDLTSERVVVGGSNITITDDGSNATFDVSPQGAGSSLDADTVDGRQATGFVWSLAKSGDTALTQDVTLSEGSNVTLTQVGNDIQIASSGGGGGGGAPTNAQYLVLVADGTLTDERVLNPGTSLSVTDNGAGGNYDIDTIQSIRAIDSPSFTGLTLSGLGAGVVQSSAFGVLSSSTLSHTSLSNIGSNTHVAIDSHIADATIHFTEGSIDHTAINNIGTNTHSQIDSHIADNTIHFTVGSIDHALIQNVGTNSHATIDSHIADASIHFTVGSIDHTLIQNIGTNSHADIDSHIADASIHFTVGSIDHTLISNIGTNSHADIDSHIADSAIHFTVGSIDHGSLDALSLTDDDHTQYHTDARALAWLATRSTSDLPEGTNLYYTDSRSRAAVSAGGDLSYDPLTGVFSVTTYKTSDFNTDFATKTTDNLAEGSTNLYYTSGRFDTDFAAKDTDDLSEGTTNLYYTSARFDTDFSGKNTDDLSEGSTNLYYTDTRARNSVSASGDLSYVAGTGVFSVTTYKTADFDTDFATKTTDDLAEGTTNLYYTDTRSRNAVSASGDLSYVAGTGVFSVTTYKSADFDSDFSGKNTDDLSEGSTNLYYTDERAQDGVGGILVDSASVDFTYDDVANTITAVVLAGGVDHGGLTGLADDDHTQYHTDARALTWLGGRSTADLPEGTNLYYTDERAQDSIGNILTNSASIEFTYDDVANTITAAALPAGIDHGSLAGLSDDDHTQYLLIDGTRAMTGDLVMGATGGLTIEFYGADNGAASYSYDGGIEWNTRRTGAIDIARTYWSNGGFFNLAPALITECNTHVIDHQALGGVYSYNVTSFEGTHSQERWLVRHNRSVTQATILGIDGQRNTKGFPVTFNGASQNITGTTETSWGHNNNSGPIVMPVATMLMKVSVCLNVTLGAGDTGSFDIEYSTNNKSTWTTLGTFTAASGKFKETFDFSTALSGLAIAADGDFSLRTNNNGSFSKTSADPSFVVYGFTNYNL